LVEDVITTGGTLLEAAKRVQEAGYQIACIMTLVDRDEGGREAIEEAGFKVYTLFRRRDFF
jgi:orotate phosphoribosyltransferase